MIIMRLRGRLGNQLFIYAYGRRLMELYHMPLLLVDNINDTGGTKLEEFDIPKNIAVKAYSSGFKYDYYNMKAEDYNKIGGGLRGTIRREMDYLYFCNSNSIPTMTVHQRYLIYKHKLLNRFSDRKKRLENEKKDARILCRNGLFVCENGYIDFPYSLMKSKNIFPLGYFQCEKYFYDIRESIQKELQLKKQLKKELEEFIYNIDPVRSVCLSIRMGDYINNPVLGVCTKEYYEEALKIVYKALPDAVVYISSDDIDSVRRIFHFKNKVIYEPDGLNEIEKLVYMSKCGNFILSNSTFSWWAQYLSRNKNKLVIAPDRWTNDRKVKSDIYQDNWILVKV